MSKLGTPYDPNSGSGVIGRNYCYQTGGGGASAFFSDKKFRRYMGGGALGIAIDEFNADNFDHSGLGFIGGGSITTYTIPFCASRSTGSRTSGKWSRSRERRPSRS
jgi:gluconate 2-dehydrogenase alpha chain